MDEKYKSEARRVDTMRRIASDQRERDYWHGYRLGITDAEPNSDASAREQRETAYDVRSPDQARAVTALGYWDGRRWQERSVRDFYQRLSVEEWLSAYGPLYGVTSAEYVRQMCRNQAIGTRGHAASLPFPWSAEQSGRQWVIEIKEKLFGVNFSGQF